MQRQQDYGKVIMMMAKRAVAGLLLCLVLGPCSSLQQEQQTLSMFHISDLHLDSLYSVAGRPGEARCHKLTQSSTDSSSNDNDEDIGPAGDYACDPPPLLIESAFKYMSKVNPNPDFILWTGDSNPHWEEGPDFAYIFSNLRNITRTLRKYFPNTIVVPALGNHDTDPPDQYPDPWADNSTRQLTFYDRYIEEGSFGDLISGQARTDFKKCGYYSFSTEAKIKFVVLNTNLYYGNKERLDQKDPCEQLKWLRTELEGTGSDEQVFLVAHIPPGYYERGELKEQMFNLNNSDSYNREFISIFTNKTLSKKISSHFYGHTHTDAFRLFMDPKSHKPRGVAFNAASVTPSLFQDHKPMGVNPSIRIYHFNISARLMLDYEQHYLPLNEVRNIASSTSEITTTKTTTAIIDTPPPRGEETSSSSSDRRLRNRKFMGDSSLSKRDDTSDGDDVPSLSQPPQFNDQTSVAKESRDNSSSSNSEAENDSQLDSVVKLWRWGYNATEAFKVGYLSASLMYEVYKEMSADEGSLIFAKYFKHNTVYKIIPEYQTCNTSCHAHFTCAIVAHTNLTMRQCLARSKGISTTTAQPPYSDETPKGGGTTTTVSTDTYSTTTVITTNDDDDDADPSLDPRVVTSIPDDHSIRGIAIGFSIVMVVAIAVGGLLLFKKLQKNRYRSQEFLLTDTFRYDGYSQVESL